MENPFSSLNFGKLSIKHENNVRKNPTSCAAATKFQEKRRSEALRRQEVARQDRSNLARQLAYGQLNSPGPAEDLAVSDAGRGSEPSSSAQGFLTYANELMQPEWMIDVPGDLETKWFVMPRPEGQRCLVLAAQGSTTSRLRNGRVLHRFSSFLPGGSRSTTCGTDVYCILDCIFHGPDNTYYIMDLMCWKGYLLYDCSAEFRFFWRDSKFGEDQQAFGTDAGQCPHTFQPVPLYSCTSEGLKAAYGGSMPFQRDGCYFLHRECRYDLEGPTPLALFWKDPGCSRFFIDTDVNGQVSEHQHILLQYCSDDSSVKTGDDPPVALAGFSPANPRTAASLKPGSLLRFTIKEGGITFQEGEPCTWDLQFEGFGNQRRGRVDLLSKILFQYLARTKPVLLEHILSCISPGNAAHNS